MKTVAAASMPKSVREMILSLI